VNVLKGSSSTSLELCSKIRLSLNSFLGIVTS
jgi:hypothetical protein